MIQRSVYLRCLLILYLINLTFGFGEDSVGVTTTEEKLQRSPVFTKKGIFLSNVVQTDQMKTQVTKEAVVIFYKNVVFFGNENKSKQFNDPTSPELIHKDKGRIINRKMNLVPIAYNRIKATLTVAPIELEGKTFPNNLADNYDKAGMVTIQKEGYRPIELVKFVTSFGYSNTHEVDVTHLAPFLHGECTFEAHVDTWKNPGYKISFQLTYELLSIEEVMSSPKGDWVYPLLYEQGMDHKKLKDGPLSRQVVIPEGFKTIKLYYLTTGHGNNEESAGEFKSRLHTIMVNNAWRLMQYTPWRNDGYKYRSINPHSGKWRRSDGEVWSSDYGRSGWMPGNDVPPKVINVTLNILPPGEHYFHFNVEDVKPKDSKGRENWRVSSYLVGFY